MTTNTHQIDQSPLFKLHSKSKLSKFLKTKLDIEGLVQNPDNNYQFFYLSSGEKKRKVEAPKPEVQRLHKRISLLLSRITPPNYLYSATKGRSYISNAQQHVGRHALIKIDISKFFPSVTKVKVFNFFRYTLQCSPDVSGILAKLLTVDGHLATGSSASPILSYYVNKDMFDELGAAARARNVTMTCYIDDVFFSGEHVSRKLLFDVQKIIRQHGYSSHKQKARYYSPGEVKVITGVAVTATGIRLPQRRHKAIHDGLVLLAEAKDDTDRLEQLDRLVGRLYEASQIDPKFLSEAKRISQLRATVRRRILSGAIGKAP